MLTGLILGLTGNLGFVIGQYLYTFGYFFILVFSTVLAFWSMYRISKTLRMISEVSRRKIQVKEHLITFIYVT